MNTKRVITPVEYDWPPALTVTSAGLFPATICALAIAAVPLFHHTEGRSLIAQGMALVATAVAALSLLNRIPSIHPAMLALLVLTGFWGITLVEHPDLWVSYRSLVKMCVLALAAHIAFRTPKHLLILFGCYASTGLISLALNWSELRQLVGSIANSDGMPSGEERFAGTFFNANVAGIYGVMAVTGALFAFFNSRHRLRWPVLMSGLIGGLAICYYCGSRKAMLSLALMPVVVPCMAMRRDLTGRIRWGKLLLLAGFTLLLSGLVLATTPHVERLIVTVGHGAQAESSSSERMAMAKRAIELWTEHPLFGCGFGGFARLSGFGVYSHSTFSEVLCNGGLIGISLLAVFYVVPALQLAGLARAQPDARRSRLCLGLLAFWAQFTLFSCFAVMLDPGEYPADLRGRSWLLAGNAVAFGLTRRSLRPNLPFELVENLSCQRRTLARCEIADGSNFQKTMSSLGPEGLVKGVFAIASHERWSRPGFVRNVFTVMSATAVAQVIGLVFTPLLSRLYGPAEFGTFGTYVSVATILGAGATLNYTDALMLPKSDCDAAPLFLAACLATIAIAIGTALGCWLVPDPWLRALGISRLGWLMWLLPLSVLLFGLSQTLTSWCVRLKAFRQTSQSQIIRSISLCATQAAGGVAGLGGAGLVGGSVAGETCLTVFLARETLAKSGSLLLAKAQWSILLRSAREYREFAFYGCPQNVLNALSQGLPVLALAHYYGIAAAGSYAFGMKLLQAPMNFVLTSIRQVLFQKLSDMKAKGGDLYQPFLQSTLALVATSFLPCSLGFLIAPWLFSFVFGEPWREAGEFGRWLILWLGVMFCNVPSTLAARILRLQRDLFLFDVALLTARVGVLLLGGLWLRSIHTIVALSLVGTLFNLALILHVGLRLRREHRAFA